MQNILIVKNCITVKVQMKNVAVKDQESFSAKVKGQEPYSTVADVSTDGMGVTPP